MSIETNLAEQMRQIELLTKEIEALPDANARTKAIELMRLLMEYHGAALDRVMEIISRSGAVSEKIFADLERDELTSGLLLLYGLHPAEVETRVANALEKVRPFLKKHDGDAELISIENGVVNLNLHGSCNGCPSSSQSLISAIEEAIYEAAPDIAQIKMQSAETEPAKNAAVNFVQIKGRNGKNPSSAKSQSLINIV